MLPSKTECPSENTMAELVDGVASPAVDQLQSHIAACDGCRCLLVDMVAALPASRVSAIATTLTGATSGAAPGARSSAVVETDRYVVRREIARGGMGRILEAWDVRHQRPVAVKILLRHDAQSSWRFVREARLTARLQHPAIVPLYEAGRWTDDEPFFAMKLVEGRSLHAAIGDAASLADRFALLHHLLAVTDALAYAHAHGVVHRDLKPSNVLLGAYGETVVVDWGLAKELRDPSGPARDAHGAANGAADLDPATTVAGSALGTPCYMPPEQARGEPVDARADVYAIGAMLYHLLTGAPPHVGRNARATVALVLEGPPPPIGDRAPELPRDLVALVEKAMAREPADRYATAEEMAADLRRFQGGQLVQAHSYSMASLVRRWLARHRVAVGMAALLVVAVSVTAGFSVRRIVRERDRANSLALVAERERATAVTQREAAEELVRFMIDEVDRRLEVVGQLRLMAGLAEKVDEYYRATSQGASLGATALGQRATALANLARAENDNHDVEKGLRFALESLALRQRALALAPDDEKALLATAQAGLDVGFAEQKLGHYPEAALRYEHAQELTEPLASRTPPSLEARYLVALAIQRRGEVALEGGDFAGGSRSFARAETMLAELVATDPARESWARWLGWARFDLSLCEVRLGHLDEAERAQTAAIAVRRAMTEKNPADFDSQRALGASLEYLGKLEQSEGRLEPALEALGGAIAIAERLPVNQADSLEPLRDLARIHVALAEVELALGHVDRALAAANRDVELADTLLKRAPEDRFFLDDSGEAFLIVASVELARGRFPEARAALLSGLAAEEKIPEANRAVFMRWASARLRQVLAQVEAATRDHRAAEEQIALARTLVEAMVKDAPDDAELAQLQGEVLVTAGDVAGGQSQVAVARELYASAVAALDRVPAPRPPSAELDSATAEWKLARAMGRDGQPADRVREAADDATTTVARLAARGVLGQGQLDAWRALTKTGGAGL